MLLACESSTPPPTHHRIELPGYGTLVVDIKMTDMWEKNYLSKFTFEPATNGQTELIVEHYGARMLPRVVLGKHDQELVFDKLNLEPLIILASELILLRLPHSRHGSESLIVRTGLDDWRRFDFDDRSLKGLPVWDADLNPYDSQHGGYSELVRVNIPDLMFTFYRHGGYLVRELQFRLARDGRSIELVKLHRAPLEARNLGRFDPAWASATLLTQVENLFRNTPLTQMREPHWMLDDIRIVAFYVCPASSPPDRLHVLFGLRKSDVAEAKPPSDAKGENYRTELWRFDHIDGEWQLQPDQFIDLPSVEILNMQNAAFKEVRDCIKVY